MARSEALNALLPQADAKLMRYNQSINLATFGFSIPGQPPVVGPFNVTALQLAGAMPLTEADVAAPEDAVASPPSPLLSMMKPIRMRAPNSALCTRTSNAFLPVVHVSGLRSQKVATSFTAASAEP